MTTDEKTSEKINAAVQRQIGSQAIDLIVAHVRIQELLDRIAELEGDQAK